MFVKLFISRWRHPKADVRINAVSKLNPDKPSDAEKLWQLALNDIDEAVRAAAILSLTQPDQLISLLKRQEDDIATQLAAKRIGELIESQSIELSVIETLRSDALLTLLCGSPNSTLHQRFSLLIEDQTALANLAMYAALASTRQAAAKRLKDKELIDQVGHHAKEQDKAVYRIIKQHQKRIQQQITEKHQAELACDELLNQFLELANSEQERHYSVRFDHLVNQWKKLSALANHEQLARFEKLTATAQHRIAQIQAAEQAEAEERARIEALSEELKVLRTTLHAMLVGSGDITISQQLEQLNTQQQVLDRLASEHLNHDQQQELTTIASVIQLSEALCNHHHELAALMQPAELINSLQECQHALEAIKSFLSKFKNWPTSFPEHALLSSLNSQLPRLQKQIVALKQNEDALLQLQQDVIAEKELLCLAMEALIDIQLPESEKAQQIKMIQQQWKELDQKGTASVKSLWERFHRASKKAYAPCEIYFREQSRLRTWNLEQRKEICNLLEQYFNEIDWNQVDWAALDQLLKKAKEEWREFSPVDRAPGKQLQERFNTLLTKADDALAQYREDCALAKQAIIDEAYRLASVPVEEFAQATQRFKELQNEWKTVGATEHKRERQLWKTFREQGDVLFNRLRDHQQLQQQGSQEEKTARLLCVRLEILLNQPSPEADQYLRMEYQMERLEEALETLTAEAQSIEMLNLIHEWKALELDEQFPDLNARFETLLETNKAL